LSRTPQLDEAIVQSILQKLPSLGYTAAPLIWTKQGE
jgi:lipocalin